MALQSLLKGDFQGIRNVIAKPFHHGILCHPICPPPKGHHHMSIFHGTTKSSEGGSLYWPDSRGVRHAIVKPFYDVVLRHPICPRPRGRLHETIFHGATEFSEGGVLMAGYLSADFKARFSGS
ncbi:hypothetical protein B9Z19DRAFT_1129621 [Tuber borchii]|uniref:Uncharacterized protein n=1 Tax=Tuber borchii TaxID=42251 RepID=A0A2T6ZM46_TUBBO|nr:hypothetical protein B9Z19DRAFT_1129621 [Tuber borchii]